MLEFCQLTMLTGMTKNENPMRQNETDPVNVRTPMSQEDIEECFQLMGINQRGISQFPIAWEEPATATPARYVSRLSNTTEPLPSR